MKFPLRPFQVIAANHAKAYLRSAKPSEKKFYIVPTGVGKSIVRRLG